MDEQGYELWMGPVAYSAWKDGRPFTLADVWRESYGVGGCTIVAPTGRVVLEDCGSLTVRSNVRRYYHRDRS